MAEVAGDAALFAAVGDSEAVAGAIAAVLTASEHQRHEWARAAVAQASTFTWERSVARHLEAYALAATA